MERRQGGCSWTNIKMMLSKDGKKRKEAGISSQHRIMNTHLGFQITQRSIPLLYVYPLYNFSRSHMPDRGTAPPETELTLHYSVSNGPLSMKHSPSHAFLASLFMNFFVLVNKQISVGAFSGRAAVEVSIISLCDYLATRCSSRHLAIFHVFQQLSVLPSSDPSLNRCLK